MRMSLFKKSANHYIEKAKEEGKKGDFQKAIEYCKEAVSREPNNPYALALSGDLLHKLKKDTDAEAEYRKARAIASNDPLFHWKLINFFGDTKKSDDALIALRDLLKLHANDRNIVHSIEDISGKRQTRRSDDAYVHTEIAKVLHQLGKNEEAGVEYRLAIGIGEKAEIFDRSGMKDIIKFPNPYIWYEYANFLSNMGRTDEAYKEYIKAITLETLPISRESRNNFKTMEADIEKEIRNSIVTDPDNSVYHLALANLLIGKRDEESIEEYFKALWLVRGSDSAMERHIQANINMLELYASELEGSEYDKFMKKLMEMRKRLGGME